MSKATNNGLLILASICGIMKVLNGYNLISRVDLKKLADDTYNQAEYAICNWGESGDMQANTFWITGVMTTWEKEYIGKMKYRAVVLVAVCDILLTDMEATVRDKNKKRLRGR